MSRDDVALREWAASRAGRSPTAAGAPPEAPSSLRGSEEIIERVRRYYTEKLRSYGPTHRGADWSSQESQRTRLHQLLRLVEDERAPFTLTDYGCGYGALLDELERLDCEFTYHGFDVSQEMVRRARELYGDRGHCTFTTRSEELPVTDYTLASGVFNVKLDFDDETWVAYVRATIHELARLSLRGFGFNVLTSYVDPGRERADLYYADPCELFDYCKRNLSRWVTLLHDYGLYEFTLLVRRDEEIPWRS